MNNSQDEFLKELLNDFKIEAGEHIQAVIQGLLKIENNLDDPVTSVETEAIFRSIHSMKGAARAVNLIDFEQICMAAETQLHPIKKGDEKLTLTLIELLYKAVDLLELMLKDIDSIQKKVSKNDIKNILSNFYDEVSSDQSYQGIAPLPSSESINLPESIKSTPPSDQKATEPDTVRVDTGKLFKILTQAEEMISLKASTAYIHNQLINLAGKLDHNQITKLNVVTKSIDQLHRQLSRTVEDLLLDIKVTLMQPLSSLFKIAPKIVRDLSREYEKEVAVDILGGEIEIDRRILEFLKDPLIHILRNCVDHGIETPEERVKSGKVNSGTITIKAERELNQKIKITISDNGRGIDSKVVIKSAIKEGIVGKHDAGNMENKEVNSLIFHSGVTTSKIITDVSGRGLGMAIVAEKIDKAGGKIKVSSEYGKGTAFTIILPKTLATGKGFIIKSSGQLFLMPSSSINRAERIDVKDIKLTGSQRSIVIKNESIPVIGLNEILGLPTKSLNQTSHVTSIIMELGDQKLALMIDEIIGEHEGSIKPLGSQLKYVSSISGATVLGNGKVVPVLNPRELFQNGTKLLSVSQFKFDGNEKSDFEEPVKVLVAEDSITVRNMLRTYLEAAGFIVTTAVDGLEAWELIKSNKFNIVVSDVEMPRMNGFELTANIKKNQSTSTIPVILVTALGSVEDRQKGLEAGADAYIEKSSFEKSNLVDTINRLYL